MNVAMILSGGVGRRFGGNIPKQYLLIKGKMVIEYVIEAIRNSGVIDKVLIVTNKPYDNMIKEKFDVDVCLGGEERNITLKNGLDYIYDNYNCDKIMIFDAVRPLVYPQLVGEYLKKLDQYDIVLTAKKITDSLGCYDIHEIIRDRYYLLQSPEAYRFDLLYKYFDSHSQLTEVAQQLPKELKTYLNFDFHNNIKITYKHDLVVAEQLLGLNEINSKFDVKRLKEFLGKNFPEETEQWINELPQVIDCLKYKWKFDDYLVNPNSHFGIIIKAYSRQWGDIIVKLIPPFIDRFDGELNLYLQYRDSGIMCPLYDYDRAFCALLLKCGQPGSCADFCKDNIPELRKFFDNLNEKLLICNNSRYHDYRTILQSKLNEPSNVKNGKKIDAYVKNANELFDKYFSDSDKYLLLGDAHKYNLIKDEDRFLAIDPIGYIAPKEIEFARFMGTVFTEDLENVETLLREVTKFFLNYSTQERILAALYIDVVFRLHNTTFENDDDVLANKWLEVLRVIEKVL
ncbi:MAG: 2-C-methyl-D-erythritol 4-phosphate cytidylyltransferase [Clostridia bacterium]|nr:2-C-methyl-D-erythritol 4-phosphate cytidylyltransferase [Clostridia bacterium]